MTQNPCASSVAPAIVGEDHCRPDVSAVGRSVVVAGVRSLAMIAAMLLLVACREEAPAAPSPTATQTPSAEFRVQDFAAIARGASLYAENCARCHGEQAQGDPNWRSLGEDGRFRPPPLNGSGHAWHHPYAQLKQTIKQGGPVGQSSMPAFADTLSDRQIDDIIAWFQSKWPDEIYDAWSERNEQATKQ